MAGKDIPGERSDFGGLRPTQRIRIETPSGETNDVEFIRPSGDGETAIVVDRDEDRRFTIQPEDIVEEL